MARIKLANKQSVLYQRALFAYYGTPYAPVAQLDRVLPSEGSGHGFESRQAHHIYQCFAAIPTNTIKAMT